MLLSGGIRVAVAPSYYNRLFLCRRMVVLGSFHRRPPPRSSPQCSCWYSATPSLHSSLKDDPMTQEEELKEKQRVASLTDYQREMELRNLEKELELLLMKKRINTGELYTIRGQFKALVQDYGLPFMVWYWTVWSATALMTYGAITLGDVDVMKIFVWMDGFTGWSLSKTVDPTLGTIGVTVAFNELLEPIRLPVVVITTKPIVKYLKATRRI